MVSISGKVMATSLAILVIVIAIKGLEDKSMTAHNHSDHPSSNPSALSSGAGGTAAGQESTPSSTAPASEEETATRDASEEEILPLPPPPAPVREVPIGTPTDPETFRELKRRAEQPDPDSAAGQSDP